MIPNSPCSKCIVFPMCKEVCPDWRKYMSLTWSVDEDRDDYAKEIFKRTLGVYGTINTMSTKRMRLKRKQLHRLQIKYNHYKKE